jgi:predicted metal-dependent phosphoesterase TrpH
MVTQTPAMAKILQEAAMLPSENVNSTVDLHLHSTCSDGLCTPTELVAMAQAVGLRAIALCDHDSIAGIDEAVLAGRECGVEVVPGIELSSMWNSHQDIHLLGYGIDHHVGPLQIELSAFRAFRRERNRRILNRINERLRGDRRTVLDFHEIQETTGDTVGRPHLARALVAKGHARNVEDAFQRYLIPYNIPKRFFPLDQAIRLVHDCGGVAVLAHPLLVTSDRDHWNRLLDEYMTLGLDGIEVYTPSITESDIDFFLGQARRRGLVVTGGSDYHGMSVDTPFPGSGFGSFAVPGWCLDGIKAALRERQSRQATVTPSVTSPASSA